MRQLKLLFDLISLTILVSLLISNATEAGLTDYLPSIGVFNPIRWFVSSTNKTRDSSYSVHTNLSTPINKTGEIIEPIATTTPKPARIQFLNIRRATTANPLHQNPEVNYTTSTLAPSASTLTSSFEPGSIIKLFTTPKPKIGSTGIKYRIKKKGKIYDTPVVFDGSNSTGLSDDKPFVVPKKTTNSELNGTNNTLLNVVKNFNFTLNTNS